jgi:predicted nucleic acid-binding Zn ribbon protein
MAKKKRKAPTKACPKCGKAIHAAAKKCKHCGAVIQTTSAPKRRRETRLAFEDIVATKEWASKHGGAKHLLLILEDAHEMAGKLGGFPYLIEALQLSEQIKD